MRHQNDTIINVSEGQVNIANDYGKVNAVQNIANGYGRVNAVQNNGLCKSELDTILNNIMENLSELESENAERIVDAVFLAKEELAKREPTVSRLRSCVALIEPMISIANGIPGLAKNLQALLEYIETHLV